MKRAQRPALLRAELDASLPSDGLLHRAMDLRAAIERSAQHYQDVPTLEICIVRWTVMLGRALSAMLEEILSPHGLNETDFRTLIMLFSQPDGVAHPTDLCHCIAQSPATLTRVADSLHERGWITRAPSEEDRRRLLIRITPAGEALVRELLPRTTAMTRALFQDCAPSARVQLAEQLLAVIRGVDKLAEARREGSVPSDA